MARAEQAAQMESPASVPMYELRIRHPSLARCQFEIWQVPSPATPHIKTPLRVAGLKGRNLQLVEHRILKKLANAGVRPASGKSEQRGYALPENLALSLGLLFRALAPMRSRDNMRTLTEGIESMGQEEAAYWLGMAMHRKYPRRVLKALRVLLTAPKTRRR